MPSPRQSRRAALALAAVAAVAAAAWWAAGTPGAPRVLARQARVDFNRDVRPILNQNCTGCHGGVKAQAGVSFVFREGAMGTGESGARTIVPGDPDASELIRRVSSTDPDYRMPEADHAPPLSAEQIATLRRWVKEGARWEEHWAFVPPKPRRVPKVKTDGWARGPVDRFVLARLEGAGLAPSPEADRAALLRRVSLDLVGLPPTPEELAAFLADRAPGAYERQVDRLLASPHYGERWATTWLDLARYADTKGYESDRGRTVWPYRDWVIAAFNRNQRYDRFVTEQLAGDLLPDATMEQRIASSFGRQAPVNDEGGTDDEEFRLQSVFDRVSTTWLALNGVTFGCAQCHAHPYDPIRHDEFYKFLAFFNNTRDYDYRNDRPVLRVPEDRRRDAEAYRLQVERTALRRTLIDSGIALAGRAGAWRPLPIVAASATLVTADSTIPLGDRFELRDGAASPVTQVRGGAYYDLLATPDPGASPLTALTALRVEVPVRDARRARHSPEPGFIVVRTEAWVVAPDGSEAPIAFRHFAHDSYDEPSPSEKPIPNDRRPPPPLDPSGFGADPKQARTRWIVGVPEAPLHLPPGARVKVRVSHGGRISTSPTTPVWKVRLAASADPAWTTLVAGDGFARRAARLDSLDRLIDSIPGARLPVMEELPARERRETRLFVRGNFLDKAGPPLKPDVPRLFPALPEDAPRDRLGLARWMFAPGQPLTARVAVNRFWEQLFGVGIVETLEDFGSVGEAPSHPELLDWLALRFQDDLRWDVKRLLRELVTSAAYRQSARATPALLAKDPRNRLIARGPRQRLTAEMVRDQALLAAGLLSRKMGGPPVMPPQPEGVWETVFNDAKWVTSPGEDRYRRAVYTYLKRSAAYPSLLAFDASARDVSLLRRIHTNTPLQALVTLNDPVYHEAATALAARMHAAGGSLDERLALGMRATVSRDPSPGELGALRRLYEGVLRGPPAAPVAAPATASLVRPVARQRGAPAASAPAGAPASPPSRERELAAFAAVASAMLNLDAALSR